jgi:protein-S-isoprenylcysteine O-methyltransferase Ste14
MVSVQLLMAACWISFLLYWLISARSAKTIQETRGWLGGNWHAILYWIGYLLIGDFKFLGRFGIPTKRLAISLIAHTILANAVAVLLLVGGLIIAITARHTLAGNWSNSVALKENHELITTGVYGYVRHPIYTGMLMMFLGTALSYGTLGAAIGFLVILIGILLKLKEEETLMTEHFAQEYKAYKEHTRTLIPFIW